MKTSLRRARPEDASEIAILHNRWALGSFSTNPNRGFLLTSANPEQIAISLSKENSLAFVAETEGFLDGYVIATPDIDHVESLIWEKSLPAYGHLHVRELAVNPSHLDKGIGRSLYGCLLDEATITTLSAFIAVEPMKNTASLAFHKKQGFQRAASFSSKEFCGLNEYRSELWIRTRYPLVPSQSCDSNA